MLKARDFWKTKVWKINKKSSQLKDKLADISLGLLAVPTIYGIVLGASVQNLEKFKQAYLPGCAIQLGMGFVYVKYIDFIRKKYNTTPNLRKDGLLDGAYLEKK